jgi:DNA-binding CsgD family transcriptional regulator
MTDGWVSIYRQIFDNKDLKDNNHILIFIYMVVHASHKPTIVTYRNKRITLKRGQLAITVKDLAKRFRLSIKNVRTILKNLKVANTLAHTLDRQLSVYTIVNYNKFQDNDMSEIKLLGNETGKQNNKYLNILYNSNKNDISLSSMTGKPNKISVPTLQSLKSKITEKPKELNEWELMRKKLDADDFEKWVLAKLNS